MRLWHEALLERLPRQQLLGQHRECCALRGNGWGKKHATVDYVFKYDRIRLVAYHIKVMNEMKRRGYNPNKKWYNIEYRGKNCEPDKINPSKFMLLLKLTEKEPVFVEHDEDYYDECINNLKEKGVDI